MRWEVSEVRWDEVKLGFIVETCGEARNLCRIFWWGELGKTGSLNRWKVKFGHEREEGKVLRYMRKCWHPFSLKHTHSSVDTQVTYLWRISNNVDLFMQICFEYYTSIPDHNILTHAYYLFSIRAMWVVMHEKLFVYFFCITTSLWQINQYIV